PTRQAEGNVDRWDRARDANHQCGTDMHSICFALRQLGKVPHGRSDLTTASVGDGAPVGTLNWRSLAACVSVVHDKSTDEIGSAPSAEACRSAADAAGASLPLARAALKLRSCEV